MNETLDTLPLGNLQMLQPERGYRYSLDPILLARFVRIGKARRAVDLGTGTGILPLLLARLSQVAELIGIELQPGQVERARRNVELNDFSDRIRIVEGDIRQIGSCLPAESADLVVSNPPYRRPDSGRLAPDPERAAARHQLAGGLAEFIDAAAWILKYGGDLALIYLAEELAELLACLRASRIEPKRLRLVHARADQPARLVLVQGRKGGRPGLRAEPPLFLYRQAGPERRFTDELLAMYRWGEGGRLSQIDNFSGS